GHLTAKTLSSMPPASRTMRLHEDASSLARFAPDFGAMLAPSASAQSPLAKSRATSNGVTPMLAEVFMLRMEAIARVAREATKRCVPIALPAPKAHEGIVFAAGAGENEARVPSRLY